MPGADDLEGGKQLIISMALLAAAVVFGFYLIGKIRGGFRQSDPGPTHLLDNFRELHSGGELSDEEYRNIKSKLASQLREKLKDAERKE